MFFSYLSLPYCSTPALFIFSPLKHLRSVGVNYLLSLLCLPCKPRICWSQLCFVTCITWWENDKLLFYFLSSQYNWSSDCGRQQSSPASVTFSNSALEEEKKNLKKLITIQMADCLMVKSFVCGKFLPALPNLLHTQKCWFLCVWTLYFKVNLPFSVS